MVGDQSAEQGPADAGYGEGGGGVALVAGALAGAEQVAEDREDRDGEPAPAGALHGAERDELGHRPGHTAQRGADQEDHDGEDEDALASEEVAELSVQRRGHAEGQQIRGADPGELFDATEVTADGRHGGGDDLGVQRPQKHGEHQPQEDQDRLFTRWGRIIDVHGVRCLSARHGIPPPDRWARIHARARVNLG
nr:MULTISPECIES: hypothetical protein [Streptomyces violaceusniger group]